MKTQIKSIALLLAVILTFSGMPGSSAARTVSDAILSTQPTETTTPTTAPTVPTTVPQTLPPTAPPATQPPTTPPVLAPQDGLTASHAFLYQCSASTYLFTKGDLNERLYPASITKLFTAYVALLYLDPTQSVTARDILYTVPRDSSLIFLVYGDVLTVEQLLHGMLLCSGGDAARVLAVAAGRAIRGSADLSDANAMAVFVEEMNRQAATIGMSSTHFVNPDGYHHDDHYSSMADMTTLAALCLNQPLIRQIASTVSYTTSFSSRTVTWKNTNFLLDSTSPFYRSTAIGLKTGFTRKAGRCLLAVFVIGEEYYLMGIFGCPDPNNAFIAQFENAVQLYDTYLAA